MLSPLKWTGSKRYIAKEIISYFPKKIDTYYEPFCGSASILIELLQSDIKVKKYIISDINRDCIVTLKLVSHIPATLCSAYEGLWEYMKALKTIKEKQEYYNLIRKTFNEEKSIAAFFLFLNRTCYNGLIRYNSKGEFNTSYHVNRDGIEPKKLLKILWDFADLCRGKDIEFETKNYADINSVGENDFLYLDPPYSDTDKMYQNSFNKEEFYSWLGKQKCKYALSYNGKSSKQDNTQDIPKELFKQHLYMKKSKSSFDRLNKNDTIMEESLYLNY